MRRDEPTVPNLGWDEPDAATGLTDPCAFAGPLSETPTWPTERQAPSPGIRAAARASKGPASALLLRVSLGANGVLVLLVGLLGAFLLSHTATLGLGGSNTGSSTPGVASGTPTIMASPAPLSGWLQVAPSAVQLGCDGDQRTQVVVLTNTGSQKVHWQAVLSGSASPAGIAVTPTQGDLDAGASLPIQMQNTTRSTGPQRSSGQQGVIRFAPESAEAGTSPSLSYTTAGCH